ALGRMTEARRHFEEAEDFSRRQSGGDADGGRRRLAGDIGGAWQHRPPDARESAQDCTRQNQGKNGQCLPCFYCGATPFNLEVGAALALIEYQLRNNPTADLKLQCDQCGKESSYDYSQILGMLDPSRRPTPLPSNQVWALILLEIGTAPEMSDRGFF